MSFWADKCVLVTGGAGFLGSYVCRKLSERGATDVVVPRREDFDLRDQMAVRRLFELHNPNLVIHLAASVGGIGANMRHPGRFFYDNLMMGALLIEQSRVSGVEKFVGVGSVCSYPKFTPVPFKEQDLWQGYPEETSAAYGLAKKMMLVQSQAYRQEYDFNSIHLLLVNLYGPGDNYSEDSSHVLMALVRRFLEAKLKGADHVVVWGDGTPTREFLFVEDAAEGILQAAEQYDEPEPLNLGTGTEVSIRCIAEVIKEETGYEGEIRWDASKPNGQPRRCLDVTKASEALGFVAGVALELGVRKTVDWWSRGARDSLRS
jgi:GDP-L-fucose synthase